MKTVAIIHGWAGGDWLFKKFNAELEQNGFKVIKKPTSADVIVAHSAGCYQIPSNARATLIMLVGLPFWPGKRLHHRVRRHRHDLWPRIRVAKGRAGFTVYLFRAFISVLLHPRLMLSAIRNHSDLSVLARHSRAKIIIIRNQRDVLNSPELATAVSRHRHVRYVELPGYHDDLHDNPKPYVDLLLKEL